MTTNRSLTTLLSQLLVAFTIEFDNEAEHRMLHRTTTGDRTGDGPWLTSMAMWANFVRYVPAGGVPLREVRGLAAISNLAGLTRWRYVEVLSPGRDGVVRLTPAGQAAQRVWQPLSGEVERRWRGRFGAGPVDALLSALAPFADPTLPEYLPVVTHGLFAALDRLGGPVPPAPDGPRDDLSVRLARTLLALTVEIERDAPVSLPVGENVLRVLTAGGVRVRDLPSRSGVSTEALSMATGILARSGCAVVEPDPDASRGKRVRLTPHGARIQAGLAERVEAAELAWRTRSGVGPVDRLRAALMAVLDQREALVEGLRPYPAGWRAQRPYVTHTNAVLADPHAQLPRYPMVLHRGGWPDGS